MKQPTIRPIKTDEDLAVALGRIDELMDADEGTPEAVELEVLAQLVELYEDKHWQIGIPSPVTAIRFRMEQGQLTEKDLEQYIGSPEAVLAVLDGRQALTLAMIRALHRHLGIPADVLIGESHAA